MTIFPRCKIELRRKKERKKPTSHSLIYWGTQIIKYWLCPFVRSLVFIFNFGYFVFKTLCLLSVIYKLTKERDCSFLFWLTIDELGKNAFFCTSFIFER